MKFQTIIPLILTLSLLGCQQTPPSPALGEGTGERETPTAENTPTPTLTPTPPPTPTEVPLEALPVDEIVKKYLAGEIDDVSGLSVEQHAAFSVALAEKKNEAMGLNNVCFTYLQGEKFCLNPQTLQPEKLPTNPSNEFFQANSFEVYAPVEFDAAGNVMFLYNGEWKTVPNSAGFDFGMRVTDPHDPRIDWPKTEIITEGEFAGLTSLQKLLVNETRSGTIVPVVPLKSMMGKIPFEVGPAFANTSTFPVATFETDSQGKTILAKISFVIPSGGFVLYEEGKETTITTPSNVRDYGTFWKTLEDGQIYYFTVANDSAATLAYSIHTQANNVEGVSLGNGQSKDISLLVGSSFIKRK